tara:strand:- start:111120 stop:111989 length:870 start_codon:yes stop_codon:yes gene_type:complete
MGGSRSTSQRVLLFVLLTAAITGIAWGVLLYFFGRAPIDELIVRPSAVLLIYLGAGGPSIAAIVLTLAADGRKGLRLLFSRVLRVRFVWWVWLLAGLLPLLVALISVSVFSAFSDALGRIVLPVWYMLIPPAAFVVFLAGPLCEELGWRGYLQPLLLTQYSPAKAAALIGTLWCFWHLPLSLTPGTTPVLDSPVAWLVYWADTVLISAIMLVVVVMAGGSVLAAMLLHWVSNIAFSHILMPLFPEATGLAWQQVEMVRLGVLAVVAIGLLWVLHARIIRPPVNKEMVGQ